MRRWLLTGIAVCLLVFALPSFPVHLSYVHSESMEPTITEGDGYILVPAGTVESGDILTFYSDERGEYVTHRVVEVTDDGFVTKGDNNPSTDQRAGYPLVTDEDVLGEVATLGDRPVVLPQFGVAVAALQTHWQLGVGALVALFAVSGGVSRSRDVARFRTLMIPLVVMAVVGTSAALVVGAPTSSVTFVATDAAEPGERSIPLGDSATRTIDATIGARPAHTHQFVETEGMTLTAVELTDRADTLRVTVPARDDPGPYRTEIRVYRYPASLPYGVVAPLQAVHPALAATATMAALIGQLSLLVWLLVDGKTLLRTRSRRRPLGRLFK